MIKITENPWKARCIFCFECIARFSGKIGKVAHKPAKKFVQTARKVHKCISNKNACKPFVIMLGSWLLQVNQNKNGRNPSAYTGLRLFCFVIFFIVFFWFLFWLKFFWFLPEYGYVFQNQYQWLLRYLLALHHNNQTDNSFAGPDYILLLLSSRTFHSRRQPVFRLPASLFFPGNRSNLNGSWIFAGFPFIFRAESSIPIVLLTETNGKTYVKSSCGNVTHNQDVLISLQ